MPTTLVDASSLYADMTVAYTYDDLYRLTQAASTSTDSALTYTKNWTYGAVGNILTSTDCGTYSYLGYQAGNYANPHAVTSVCGKTYTYDRNGNVTSDGTWTNAWNWRNELTQSTSGTTTVTYAYGHDGNRVSQSSTSGNSLVYPNGYYTVHGTETKRHVMAGALGSVATSTYDGTASEFVYHHKDHLGGTHIETDDTGAVLEYIIYKPFGDTLLDTKSSTYENDLKYTGKEKDVDTGYYYYGARYYNADIGRFLSQDPVYLGFGSSTPSSILSNPQELNSYAYVLNNPIIKTDPTGMFWWYGFYDWSGYSGVSGFAMKMGEIAGGHTRAMATVNANRENIANASAAYGVDSTLTTAIMVEEQSHLMPLEGSAEKSFPGKFAGGVGVMQVREQTADRFGDYSRAQLARDRSSNIDAATAYLGSLSGGGTDTAQVARDYNGSGAHAQLYSERISAQLSNPKYNTNIAVDVSNTVTQFTAGMPQKIFNFGKSLLKK